MVIYFTRFFFYAVPLRHSLGFPEGIIEKTSKRIRCRNLRRNLWKEGNIFFFVRISNSRSGRRIIPESVSLSKVSLRVMQLSYAALLRSTKVDKYRNFSSNKFLDAPWSNLAVVKPFKTPAFVTIL